MLMIWLWPLEGKHCTYLETDPTLQYHICIESQSVNTLGDALADVICALCLTLHILSLCSYFCNILSWG